MSENDPAAWLPAACAVAAEHADEVDRDARVPAEAIEVMRQSKALSCSLPSELGGADVGIPQLAAIARSLGAACSASAMVFAMHHSQALILTRFADLPAVEAIARDVAEREALIASSTTEIGTGGDVGSSVCSVSGDEQRVSLQKQAPVISYAEAADYIFATARRSEESSAGDQVLVATPSADLTLERTGTWDTIGFRGTVSPGYVLSIDTPRDKVLPVDYADISSQVMQPASHTLWASVWLGMADAAVAVARGHARKSAQRDSDSPAVTRFAELLELHQRFDASVQDGVRTFDELFRARREPTVAFTLAMNNLKLEASTRVVDVVTGALALCGINAYRLDHATSMDRLLRDCFAPQLMVSNDRIRKSNASLALAARGTR